MLVLAAVIALTTATRSLHADNERIIDARFGADLIVYGRHVGEVAAQTVRLPGVSGATAISYGRTIGIVSGARETANLVLIEPDDFFAIAGFPWNGRERRGRSPGAGRAHRSARSRRASRTGTTCASETRSACRPTVARSSTRSPGPTAAAPDRRSASCGNVDDERLRTDEDVQSAVYINFDESANRENMLDRIAPVLRKHGGLASELRWERSEQNSYGSAFGPYFAISGAEIKDQARESWTATCGCSRR